MKKSALLATLLAALTLSACGGGSPAVCDEYQKAIENSKELPAETKASMKEQLEGIKKMSSDQQELACKNGLTGLQEIAKESSEAAKDAAEEAKEATADAKEEAKDAAEAAKEEAK